ncbi:hypothetical protein BV918_20165 [Pectobacterium odoriferum]|nr:hypothetical protein BV925_19130 [Pectobacterium odoriferum]POD98673.1 hypothetical protein BVY05_19750 [Pectobacterium odoriferum]POE00050.1 hypothetical protein BV916_20960 [Pectobacterium odoriferum]POE15826.1 hypothetical protein BV918_20165 [Pectobacterium odoriferum]POE19991.1 hypothetical protein BV923_18480 [Pectobacterium odoriferum]
MHVRWLRSVTRITYLSKLIGMPSLAAFLKLELFRYTALHIQPCIYSVTTPMTVTTVRIAAKP